MYALSRPWFLAVVGAWLAVGAVALYFAAQHNERAMSERRADAVRDAAYPPRLLADHKGVEPVAFRFSPPPPPSSPPANAAPSRPPARDQRLHLPSENEKPSGLAKATPPPSRSRDTAGLQNPEPAPLQPTYGSSLSPRSVLAPLNPPTNEPTPAELPSSPAFSPRGAGTGSFDPTAEYHYPTTEAASPQLAPALPGRQIEPWSRPSHEQAIAPPVDAGPNRSEPAPRPAMPMPRPAPNPAAMKIVANRAEEFNRSGFALAQRAAYYSARADFIQALRLIAQAIDAQAGGDLASQSLSNGLRALEEAEDFRPKGSRLEADLNVAALAAGHRTNVWELANIDPEQTSPLLAVQLYYAYAQEQLTASCGGQPAGSTALYGLGKLQLALAKAEGEVQGSHGPQAMAFFQAAMMADPMNQRASNELGVMLGRYGQWQDARAVLLQSLSVRPMAETWHNLAVVHEQLNEPELARQARREYEIVKRNGGTTSASGVQWVDPNTFARTNPGPAGPPVQRENTAAKAAPEKAKSSSWRLPWQR